MQQLQKELEQLKVEHLSNSPPPFGHACKSLYSHDEDYIELNNGSFGSCPRYVQAAVQVYQKQAERRPDAWHRGGFRSYLNQARAEVARLVNCHQDDLVLQANATTGVNAVMRGLQCTWSNQGNEAIMVYNTAYGACSRTAQYIIDSNQNIGLQLIRVELTYPLETDEILRKTTDALNEARQKGLKVRVALTDAISSLPGVVVPWQELVRLLRTYDVLSLIDGAHAVGQMPLDLTKADPDFFVSNCHKWLSAHRACAFLYVPKRNQHLVPGMPTSHYYISPADPPSNGPALLPTDAPSNFVASWEFTGTVDMANYLSTTQAIQYRQWLGGEKAIMTYNHQLAVKGGAILTSRLGPQSTVMGGQELTACMVNVSVPLDLDNVDRDRFGSVQHIAAHLQTQLAENNPTFVPFYVHDDKIWIRASAQIWLEESDFEWLADDILDTVKGCGWSLITKNE
ncbi:unnamed protein product [Sympodiomycopsis kandeliae]